MIDPPRLTSVAEQLAAAGCVAPLDEARELSEAAGGNREHLASMLARRVTGEPLAWITGGTDFASTRIKVDPAVYVPRWQSEHLLFRAVAALPETGRAVDLCTGSGALAVALARARPVARVLAADIDGAACRCARANGVEVFEGHLADPLPAEIRGRCDVVTAVPPYVPTPELAFLPRDVRIFEPRLALDGGPDGLQVARQVVLAAAELLRSGGVLLVELGGDQDRALEEDLLRAGFCSIEVFADEDGDLRGVQANKGG